MAQKIIRPKSRTKSFYGKPDGLAALVTKVEQSVPRAQIPEMNIGDTVKVHVRVKEGEKVRVQIYEGTLIARRGHGGNKSFNVRKISHGVGVERIFMENSPKVAKVEVVSSGKVRRAKLYYLRALEGKAARLERDHGGDQSAAASEAVVAKAPAAPTKQ